MRYREIWRTVFLVFTNTRSERLDEFRMADQIVLRAGALRAAKPLRPARALERFGALRLGAEVAQKLRDRHAVLGNWIWCPDIRSLLRQKSSNYGLSGSLAEPAEAGF